MGLKIKELVNTIERKLDIGNLHNKKIAIDIFNTVYQILFSVKDRHGNLFKNNNGDVTSHLIGLFYKNIYFIENNVTPIYCFDGLEGKSMKLKRPANKVKYTTDMIKTTKELLDYMGISWIQSPSEGEAQCCEILDNGDVWAVMSKDYDVLLYGGYRMLKNIKRKEPIIYISLQKFLEELGITQDQLIDISILIGNDYFCGVKGFGEKTAYKNIIQYKDIEHVIENEIELKDKTIINKKDFLEDLEQLRNLFKYPNVDHYYKIKKKKPDFEKLREFLIEKNNFDEKRTSNQITKFRNLTTQLKQVSMIDFVKVENDIKTIDQPEPEIKPVIKKKPKKPIPKTIRKQKSML